MGRSKADARERRRQIGGWLRTSGRTLLALLPITLVVFGVKQYRFSERADPLSPRREVAVGPHVATPLFAARRTPSLVSAPLTSTLIKAKLESLATTIPAKSCLGVIADGQLVGSVNLDQPVIPASTMKVITAVVALEKLGPDYTFTTNVYGTIDEGQVQGDLVVVGGGDPLLATPKFREASKTFPYYVDTHYTELEGLITQLRAGGVRAIKGALVGVNNRYEGDPQLVSWPKSQVSPVGGLVVNDTRTSYVDQTYGTDPAKHAVEQLGAIMKNRITLLGDDPKSAPMPENPGPLIAHLTSIPLKDIVAAMLTRSENTMAEMLFREIGFKATGSGSFASSSQVVTDTLTAWGVPMDGVIVHDGSGLDRGDQVTCKALLAVLSHGGPASDLAAGLATPGRGTLAEKFLTSSIKDRLRAKTGTLTGVRALAGYVTSTPEHSVTFALVFNSGDADARADPAWNILGDAMASFPAAVDVTAFVPQPAIPG